MHAHTEPPDDFTDLSAEILQLRNRLRTLEPEDIHKLGDGLRRLREILAAIDGRLTAAATLGTAPDSRLPSRLWRTTWTQALATAEAGYREAQAALLAEESVEARQRCHQAILAYDKLLAMFPPALP